MCLAFSSWNLLLQNGVPESRGCCEPAEQLHAMEKGKSRVPSIRGTAELCMAATGAPGSTQHEWHPPSRHSTCQRLVSAASAAPGTSRDPLPWGCISVWEFMHSSFFPGLRQRRHLLILSFESSQLGARPSMALSEGSCVSLACQTPPLPKHKYPAQEASSAWAQSLAEGRSRSSVPRQRARGRRQSGNSISDTAGTVQRCVAPSSSHSYSQTKTLTSAGSWREML